MTTLLLVRHGATPWTAEHRLQGRTDIDLSGSGRAEVAALAPTVATWAPRSVVVSPLARARSTAALLTATLPTAPEPVVDDRWAEHGLGDWEGLTPDEIGADYRRWRAGELTPPGGETAVRTRRRVAAAVRDAARHDGPVLVVTHGGIVRAALAECLGLSAAHLVPAAAPSMTVLDVVEDAVRLRHYNLAGPGPGQALDSVSPRPPV